MALKVTKLSNAAADNIRTMVSKYVTSADGDNDYAVFEMPRGAYIIKASLDVKTVYTAASTGSVTVGVKENGAAIAASALADNAVSLPLVAGSKAINKPYYFANGGLVTVTIAKGNSAADVVARLFVVYSVIK